MRTVEQWRPVAGYERLYEVSDAGRVRSLDRLIPNRRTGGTKRWRGRILTPVFVNPYYGVSLCRDGVARRKMIAHAVLEAFVGPRPPGQFACHGDGTHTDNRLANLRWDTESANAQDRVQHGRHWLAERAADVHGHLLMEPNLATGGPGNTRICLACTRADAGASYSRLTGRAYDRNAEADRHYQEIMSGTARGAMATRTHCLRDHPLVEPNLVASVLREGRRSCLACARAHARKFKADRTGRDFDFQAVSDAIYAEIMQLSAPDPARASRVLA